MLRAIAFSEKEKYYPFLFFIFYMMSLFRLLIILATCAIPLCAQETCPRLLVGSPAKISIEGRFLNRESDRVGVNIGWKHHIAYPDTFDIFVNGHGSFLYITTQDYRYIVIQPQGIKRQMAYHHLREFIPGTPIHWDDLEILANGQFSCKSDAQHLKTALSQTWFGVSPNAASEPSDVKMSGASKEWREIKIHSWKTFDKILLPAVFDVQSSDYSGSLWIKTAVRDTESQKSSGQKNQKGISIFRSFDGESKTSLILEMD